MSLPNLSALNLTGTDQFRMLREDSPPIFGAILDNLIGSYRYATFYHSEFCNDATAFKKALPIWMGGPDMRAYELLYALFVEKELIPQTLWPAVSVMYRVIRQRIPMSITSGAERNDSENAKAYFTRVCDEAGAFRDQVFEFISNSNDDDHQRARSKQEMSYRFQTLIGAARQDISVLFEQPLLNVWMQDRPFVIELLSARPDNPRRNQTWVTADNDAFWKLYSDDAEVVLLTNSSGRTLNAYLTSGDLTELMNDLDFLRKLSKNTSASSLAADLIDILYEDDPEHPALDDYETMLNCLKARPEEDNFSRVGEDLRADKEFVKQVFVETPRPGYQGPMSTSPQFEVIWGLWDHLPLELKGDGDLIDLAIAAFAGLRDMRRGDSEFVTRYVLPLMQPNDAENAEYGRAACEPYEFENNSKDMLFKFVSGVYNNFPTKAPYSVIRNDAVVAKELLCMCQDVKTFRMLTETLKGNKDVLKFMLEMDFETPEEQHAFLWACLRHIPDSMTDPTIRDAFESNQKNS